MASTGQVFGKYELLTKVASSSVGEVWVARERAAGMLAQDVAVKILGPQVSADPTFLKMFLDEARRAAPITHQHIAQTLDLIEHEGSYGLVTELVPGETLTTVLERARSQGAVIPVRLATTLAFHAAQALHATHTLADNLGRPLQLVHKGVTPNNMIVGFGGGLKVTDVGTAWVVTQVGTLRAATGPEKYRYMSPEQCLNTPLDLRTDIFSLGVVLWELLAGRRLHDGDDEFAIKQAVSLTQPAPLPGIRAEVSSALNEAVMRALAKNPATRWPSAQAFGGALQSALQSLGGPMQPSEVADFMARLFPQRHSWWGKVIGQTSAAPPAAPSTTAAPLASPDVTIDDDDDDLSFGDSADEFNVEATLTDFKLPEGLDLGPLAELEPADGASEPQPWEATLDEAQPPAGVGKGAGAMGFGLQVPPSEQRTEASPAPAPPAPAAPSASPPAAPAAPSPAPPAALAPSPAPPAPVAPSPAPPAPVAPSESPPAAAAISPAPPAPAAPWDGDGTLDEPMAPQVASTAGTPRPLADLEEAPVDMGGPPAAEPARPASHPLQLVPDGYEPDPYLEDPYVEPPLVPEFRLTDVVAQRLGKSKAALGPPATEILQHRGGSALSSHSLSGKSKPFQAPQTALTVAMTSAGVTTVTVGAGLTGTVDRRDGSTEAVQPGTTLILRDGDRAAIDTADDSWIVRVFRPPIRPRGLELDISIQAIGIALLLAALVTTGVAVGVNEAEKEGMIVKVEQPQKEKFADARIRKIQSLKPKKKKIVRVKRPKPKKPRKAPKKVAKNKVAPKPVPKPVVKPPDPTEAKPRITNKQRERIAKVAKDKYAGKTKKEKVDTMFKTPSKGAATNFKSATSNVQAVKAKNTSGAFRVAGDPTHVKGGEVRMAVGGGTGTGPVTKGGPAAMGDVPKLAARAKPKKVRGKVSGLRAAARVSGSLSRGEVLKVIGKHMGRIRRCYERQLMANPRLAGKLTAQWSITAAGRVSGARQRTSTLGNGKVSACVLKVIRGMKFPKPKGGAVKITYPFIFRSVS